MAGKVTPQYTVDYTYITEYMAGKITPLYTDLGLLVNRQYSAGKVTPQYTVDCT